MDGTARSAARPSSRAASRRLPLAAGIAAAAFCLALGLLAGWALRARTSAPAAEPRFTRLTFEQGTVWNARFTPDAQTVVYDAAWNGQPIRLFFTRLDTPQSMPVSLPDAGLLGVSQTGELAVSLGHSFEGWMGEGTLARAPLLGGGARPVLEGVREADFSPDGSQLAIVRRVDGRERLELPAGRVLYETAGYISHVRVSPRGDRIAFADHALWADDVGTIAVVDLSGAKKTLTGIWAGGVSGLAWSPSGGRCGSRPRPATATWPSAPSTSRDDSASCSRDSPTSSSSTCRGRDGSCSAGRTHCGPWRPCRPGARRPRTSRCGRARRPASCRPTAR